MNPVIALLALVIAASPGISIADGRPVAATTLSLEDKARARTIASEMWYPPAGNPRAEDLSFRPPLRPVSVARDAEPDPVSGKRPLIVVSHGNWGSRYAQGWLALELVKSGYVALTLSHPGTVGDDQTPAGRYRLWDRSKDVSFALDEVLQQPKWAKMIDAKRIGFVGHSFGGWTGVSLAGGRYDPAMQRAFCAKLVTRDTYCDATLRDDVARIPASDAAHSFTEPRIGAFYIMGSGPAQGFAVDSLKSIRAAFLVDTAQFDEILEPRQNSSTLARHISGAREIVRRAGHFVYVPECRPVIGRMLAGIAGVPICSDPEGVDRAAVHRQIARDVIDFFGTALPKG